MKQLKVNEIQQLRDNILNSQNGCCAICGAKIDKSIGFSLDHQHKTSSETLGEDGAGLIRGVLCRACNVLEGKIWNNMRRYIQPKSVQERIDYLKSVIKYYESGTFDYIHPSEKPKEAKVSKRNYNKLKRNYKGKAKFPEYPKSGKLTKPLSKLFEQYDINPYN